MQSHIGLVTGSSSGIGREAARSLNASGWTLILTGRRQDALDETLSILRSERADPRTIAVAGDLTDPAFVAALFERITGSYGRLDLLFNNAGSSSAKSYIDEVDLDDFSTVLKINVTASFHCAQKAFGLMRHQMPQGGRIINNGSISAHVPRPLSAPYSISKHAISGLTKTLALEGREFNIAACQIDIGNAKTAISAGNLQQGTTQAGGNVAVEPGFEVVHVGEAVAYMANLPLHVNVLSQTIMATTMPYVGRG